MLISVFSLKKKEEMRERSKNHLQMEELERKSSASSDEIRMLLMMMKIEKEK